MFGLSVTELLIVLAVVLILFGAGRLPKVLADLGKGVAAFKKTASAEPKPAPVKSVKPAAKAKKANPKKAVAKKTPAKKTTKTTKKAAKTTRTKG